MESCWNDTVTGLTDQLVSIRQMAKKFPEQEFLVSTCFFNNEVSFPSGIMRSDQIQMPSMENLRPNGCTALFDAIGDSIRKIEQIRNNEGKCGPKTSHLNNIAGNGSSIMLHICITNSPFYGFIIFYICRTKCVS